MSFRRKLMPNPTVVDFRDGVVINQDERFKALETRLEATEQHAATQRRIELLEAEIKTLHHKTELHHVDPAIKQKVMDKLTQLESRRGGDTRPTQDEWLRERQRLAAMQAAIY